MQYFVVKSNDIDYDIVAKLISPLFEQFDWLISKLISISPNQNACLLGKLVFYEINEQIILHPGLAVTTLHLLLCTDVCHIWSTVNQSICIFYRHQLYYTLVCSMFVSNDFSNCSFGYQWQVHSCENFLFVFS